MFSNMLRKRIWIIVLSAVLGSLVGVSTAFAGCVCGWDIMEEGSYSYPDITHTRKDYEETYGFPTYQFDHDHYANANQSFTQFTIIDTGYWDGTVQQGYTDKYAFGVEELYDEYGEHHDVSWAWFCYYVHGIDNAKNTWWQYGGLDEDNNWVNTKQFVLYDFGSSCTNPEYFSYHLYSFRRP